MTDLPYLASRLYGTPLLIARPKLDVILGVMARKLAGDPLRMPVLASASAVAYEASTSDVVEGVAVIPVLGILVRRSSYLEAESGLTSYHDIEVLAETAFADPTVNAVLLEIDSSGGEAGGVFDLAHRLRSLSLTSGKPLWAMVDEAALSAAYAIACAAEQIWITRTAEVGSIGVVAVHVDESAADAKAGLQYTFLHAGQHKVDGHPHAPLTLEVSQDIQADIDQLYTQFIEQVADFRGLSQHVLSATEARVYRGHAALQAGLADHIGTRREALMALQQWGARQDRLPQPYVFMPQFSAALTADMTHNPTLVSQKEIAMSDHLAVSTADDTQDPASQMPDTPTQDQDASTESGTAPAPESLNEAAITAQVEARLRRQLAELTEIAAQAKRLGVTVDPAKSLANGVSPDALRQTVLTKAAERGIAEDILAQSPAYAAHSPITAAESPLVQAAKAYGGRL